MCRVIRLLLASFMAVFMSMAAAVSYASTWPSHHAVNGGIALVAVGSSNQAPTVYVALGNKRRPVLVVPSPSQAAKREATAWTAVVGVPLGKAKPFELWVNGVARTVAVSQREYPAQYLTVKNKHVNPNTKQLTRAVSEINKMKAAYRTYAPLVRWPEFRWPIVGLVSSPFGFQRFFNGQPRKPHSGIDIAANVGTPIHAPAGGVVTVVGDFYFNGKTVMIDHGQGLVSMLCHMSRVDVKTGQTVALDDVIGAVGATGRVTGPHVHWTVSLNDVRVDPTFIMGEKKPQRASR